MKSTKTNDPVLTVEDLSVAFFTEEGRVDAVRDVSFSLERGQTLSIVGESGSGKSVSAYAILQLIQKPGRITGGKITLYPQNGEPLEITGLLEKDDRLYHLRGGLVSMIFQEPMTALSPVYTVGNQIIEAILIHQEKTKNEAEAIAVAMLDRVGIPNPEKRIKQYPHEMSGGMRQRVVIAMALVCRPEVLIADEPTTALDVTIQAQILQLIKELKDELGTSVLFITHDLGVVAQISDQVVVMNDGRVVETADVRTLFANPLHPYTRSLLGAMPRLDRKTERLADTATMDSEVTGLPEGFSIHPSSAEPGEPVLHQLADRKLLLWPNSVNPPV